MLVESDAVQQVVAADALGSVLKTELCSIEPLGPSDSAAQLNSMLHSPKLKALASVHFKKGRNRIEPITKNMKRRGPIFYYHWRY